MNFNHQKIVAHLILSVLFAFFANLIPEAAQAAPEIPLDVFWSAATIAPEDYPGKTLAVKGSLVSITVLTDYPNRKTLDYQWSLDKDQMVYSSGLGKSSFSFTATGWPGAEHSIQVRVSDPKNNNQGFTYIFITIEEPSVEIEGRKLVFLEEKNFFKAVPYYFTSPNLDFLWSFNNQGAKGENIASPEIFLLEVGASYQGPAGTLDVIISNPKNFLEVARKREVIKVK